MDELNEEAKKMPEMSGSLIYDGNETIESEIKLIEYNNDIFKIEKFEECRKFTKDNTVKWIKLNGFTHIEIKEIGKCFNLHPLVLEDMDTDQRPKIDEYRDYLFIIVKVFNKLDSKIITKQVCIILGENFLISTQEKDNPIFDNIEKQISIDESIIRDFGADFLLYSLLQTVVDSYFIILEDMEDKIDSLEKELIYKASKETLNKINMFKKDVITIRKGIWPLTEVLSTLVSSKFPVITEDTSLYMRNVYADIRQVSEMLDNFRDSASSMLDTYLSSMSNNLNEIVRVLTIITVLFAPITFLSGFFGMNFQNFIPIFSVDWIFYLSISIMIILPLFMILIFKRYRWF